MEALKPGVAVVAIGGNSLITDRQHEDVPSQYVAVKRTCRHIANMIERGWNVILTHGNGPQVGFILRRNELAAQEVHVTPLDVIGGDTQGSIGYMICQCLANWFRTRQIDRSVAAVITQVLVSKGDPAFKNPSKGIGGFATEDEVQPFIEAGWTVKEDAGRGWRRVIASPKPKEIIESKAIKQLIDSGFVVVAIGGGGIPVIRTEHGDLQGTRAVIDKDWASGLLAKQLGVDLFLISTAVEKVAINFGKPDEQWLDELTVSEAKKLYAEGHFLPGSMGPKIAAVIDYLEANPEGVALVTDPASIVAALDGKTGTRIVAS